MYKATIKTVSKMDDELRIIVEFTDGETTFEKEYPFVHMVDIDMKFEETILMELDRINGLEEGFKTLKAKEGKEIKKVK